MQIKSKSGRTFLLPTEEEQVILRIEREVLATFKGAGDGWQTRMNDALKDWLASHRSV